MQKCRGSLAKIQGWPDGVQALQPWQWPWKRTGGKGKQVSEWMADSILGEKTRHKGERTELWGQDLILRGKFSKRECLNFSLWSYDNL